MTNYLFISNSSNFKIDNNLVNQINLILDNQNIEFSNREIKKNDFYDNNNILFNNKYLCRPGSGPGPARSGWGRPTSSAC